MGNLVIVHVGLKKLDIEGAIAVISINPVWFRVISNQEEHQRFQKAFNLAYQKDFRILLVPEVRTSK